MPEKSSETRILSEGSNSSELQAQATADDWFCSHVTGRHDCFLTFRVTWRAIT